MEYREGCHPNQAADKVSLCAVTTTALPVSLASSPVLRLEERTVNGFTLGGGKKIEY